MEKSYKEQLSEHVVNIFKGYSSHGLHLCDIATGGGKSYTIGKLTCEFYPSQFDRIIILCVQNKLVVGMNQEIDRFINGDVSLISPSDKLVIENNPDVIKKAIKNGTFKKLLEEMDYQIDKQSNQEKLKYNYNSVVKTFKGLVGLINSLDTNGKNDYIQTQIDEAESNLRKVVRNFFNTYKNHLEKTKQQKKVSLESIIRLFPSLIDVYPQVEYRKKKVLLMTVHKAMYGIDPILYEKITLQDFAEKNKKTLILFDESDQAAISMRSAIIKQSIDRAGGSKRFTRGYNGYLEYKALTDTPEHISNEYYGTLLENCLKTAHIITNKNWKRFFGNTIPYKNIFLDDLEEIETFRRGVFFSGPAMKLNISPKGEKSQSFICYKKGKRHLSLVHSEDEESLRKDYAVVIPISKFLSLIIGNTIAIKTQLRKVITESLNKSREQFLNEQKEVIANTSNANHYLGYPTREREIHTLFSRFEISSEYQLEQQMNEFLTNRKNLLIKGCDTKLLDFSVYSQGVQFYQEEIDERDNQHRIKLSCREISTTPEKILVDLANSDNTSVVLCSATSSSSSVVSNYDIEYLKQTLGSNVHSLSIADRVKFDELTAKTYPQQHRIEIVPIENYIYQDKRETLIRLPEKYKNMFSPSAIEDGLPEKWFRVTLRGLKSTAKNDNDIFFQLYRLFQFIESYHWFISHDEIHSMLYFQNRTGDKDKLQINLLSSLIDGSYKDMLSEFDDEIPSDWENNHIRISKDWEQVEKNILSELSQDKDAKLMLVSAYGSFKAGANLQYEIPEGLDYLEGDNWTNENRKMKKDWDAIYVQSPTAYLMMNEDGNESTYEKSLYNAMLTLMMLYERGCLSKWDVSLWLGNALANNFMFGVGNNPGIAKDKAAWAQTTVEQAIGRLCRTRNKPSTTYILFDESMKPFFDAANLEKSLTKEFRTLADFILKHNTEQSVEDDPEEIKRCNDANKVQAYLDKIRRDALRYTVHPSDEEQFDEDLDDDVELPHVVKSSQIMLQSFKQTIIKKPVISSLDDLDDNDRLLTFISKCYGNWNHDKNGEYLFACKSNPTKTICPIGKGKTYPISPSSVRLDVLMKNPIIKEHFERNGFATSWKEGGLILHPRILREDYAGEIGEEAFKAIVLHYTNCTEDSFRHLEGRDYELADFVVCNPDGSYKIAFDVKNMNPKADHNDRPGDMSTTEKRREKKERLKCELITVNMLPLEDAGMDEIREIGGVIDEDGNVIPSAKERIINLIDGIQS